MEFLQNEKSSNTFRNAPGDDQVGSIGQRIDKDARLRVQGLFFWPAPTDGGAGD
jgi:hypothetical protein